MPESEEVATIRIEARRCTQNLLLSDQDTTFARCRPIGVGHKWGFEEVGRISNDKRATGVCQTGCKGTGGER